MFSVKIDNIDQVMSNLTKAGDKIISLIERGVNDTALNIVREAKSSMSAASPPPSMPGHPPPPGIPVIPMLLTAPIRPCCGLLMMTATGVASRSG